MDVIIARNAVDLGQQAGVKAAELIREAISRQGYANVILATGSSQFETLRQLIVENVNWSKVTMFHLDEYVGLPNRMGLDFRNILRNVFWQR